MYGRNPNTKPPETYALAMQGRIEPNKLQLDPWQDAAGLHVIVNVENYDGSCTAAPISLSFSTV